MKDSMIMIMAGIGNIALFLSKFNVFLSTIAAVLTISYGCWKWYTELYPKKAKSNKTGKDK